MTIEQALQKIQSIPKYSIEIGVFTSDGKRENIDVGITNAELMFIHEYGSSLNNIPARPVLQMTIDWANADLVKHSIDKALMEYIKSGFNVEALEKQLNIMCSRMEQYARDLIYSNDGRLASNAESTVNKKGYNHPLFQTGQLAKSITCRLKRVG